MIKRKGKFHRAKGLSFYAKIKYLDGRVSIRLSPLKKKIFHFLPNEPVGIKWIYIRVTYKPRVINEGKYYAKDIDEMWKAWSCFTEEDYIKEVIANY